MTPWDIYRKWKIDLSFIPPEGISLMLGKTCAAIKLCEEIHDAGVQTEGAQEAIEVMARLRKHEAEIRLRR